MPSATPLKIISGGLSQFATTDTVPLNNLGTGTTNSTTFLRGDGTWAVPPAGSGNITFSATAPTTPANGDVWINSDTGIKYTYVNDGTSSQWVELDAKIVPANVTFTKAVSIFTPAVNDNVTLLYTSASTSIAKLVSVVSGNSPSVTYTIKYGSSKAAGTEILTGGFTSSSTTTGNVTTSFTNPIIPTDNFVWLEISAVGGTVTEFYVNLNLS